MSIYVWPPSWNHPPIFKIKIYYYFWSTYCIFPAILLVAYLWLICRLLSPLLYWKHPEERLRMCILVFTLLKDVKIQFRKTEHERFRNCWDIKVNVSSSVMWKICFYVTNHAIMILEKCKVLNKNRLIFYFKNNTSMHVLTKHNREQLGKWYKAVSKLVFVCWYNHPIFLSL
jgi:hypothetical protein